MQFLKISAFSDQPIKFVLKGLKRIQQITNKTKTQLYALFVDLSAAFDHINRKWLFKTIRQRLSDDQETCLLYTSPSPRD